MSVDETQILNLKKSLSKVLTINKKTLTVVESCTGGGIGYYMTKQPGSSSWLHSSLVTYSNEAKSCILGIQPDYILKYGAVSQEVAMQMAINGQAKTSSNIALSVTGIAGPSGGTTFKPTGTVYFGLSNDLGERKYQHTLFKGSREEVRIQSIFYGLTFLYEFIT